MEAIFHIVTEKQAVRAKDIARRLEVTSPSVTKALRSLSGKGLLNYAPYEVITLTSAGQRLARNVMRRHQVLRNFLTEILRVAEQEAEDIACRMEHALTDPILERLVKFLEYMGLFCPLGGKQWTRGFEHYCDTGEIHRGCGPCIAQSP